MDTYQSISMMIMFGMLLLTLISYLDRNNNGKK
ncbi:putative holin-like toxin [Alkaliphilus serpentinus]